VDEESPESPKKGDLIRGEKELPEEGQKRWGSKPKEGREKTEA